jgi:selenocysteine lyase/cysteine desulfurase
VNDEIRKIFPITRNRIYLNNAAQGPLPTPVIAAAAESLSSIARNGYTGEDYIARELAEELGPFLGCGSDLITFTQNTTHALGLVALGLQWKKGDNIVTCDQEYPGNMYPWLRLEKNGIEVRIVKSENYRVPLDRIAESVDERTRVIALSWVEFFTGFRNDLEAISKLAHTNGAFLIVDGMQGIGTMPFDMEKLGVDAVAFSGVKWMCAHGGCGVLALSRKLFDTLDVVIPGAFSVKDAWNFTDYKLDYDETALRFICGCVAFPILHALRASVRLMKSVGMENIGNHIRMITNRAVSGLTEKGYNVISARNEKNWSAIVTFEPGGHDAEEVVEELFSKEISLAARQGFIRISPHFYNVPEEIDAVLEALPEPK